MARSILSYDGQVHPADSDYPSGDIKDDSGANDGTENNRKSNADMQQFFQKILRLAVATPNGLPDNEYNGFQLIESIFKLLKRPGEYIPFDRSSSAIISGRYNPFIEVLAGAPNLGDISLEDSSTAEIDLGCVLIKNNSSNSIDITPNGSDTINGGANYVLAAGDYVEFILNKAGGDWVVAAES